MNALLDRIAYIVVCRFFGCCFRRQYRKYQLQIEVQKEALRAIMYRTHHQGINPVCKRIRGISSLGIIVVTRLQPCDETKEALKYFRMIEYEALGLETETLKKVKEFEHLQ